MSAYQDSLSKAVELKKTHQKWWLTAAGTGGLVTLLSHGLANSTYAKYEETTSWRDAEKYWDITESRDYTTRILARVTLGLLAPPLLKQWGISKNLADIEKIPLQYKITLEDSSLQKVWAYQFVEDGIVLLHQDSLKTNTEVQGEVNNLDTLKQPLYLSKLDWRGHPVWREDVKLKRSIKSRNLTLTASARGLFISGIYAAVDSSATLETFIIRTNSSGLMEQEWEYAYRGDIQFIWEGQSGGLITVSHLSEPDDFTQYEVARFDSQGNTLGALPIFSKYYLSLKMILDTGDGLMLGGDCRQKGQYDSDIYLHKMDYAGRTRWGKAYGKSESSEFFNAMTLTAEGRLAVWTNSVTNNHVDGLSLMYVDTDGEGMTEHTNKHIDVEVTGKYAMHSWGDDLLLLSENQGDLILLNVEASGESIYSGNYEANDIPASLGLHKMSDGSLLLLNHRVGDDENPSSVAIFRTFIMDN